MKGAQNNIKLAIKMELTSILYRNLPIGLTGLILMATLIVWQLWGNIKAEYLIIWYLALCFNLLCGFIIIFWYKKTKTNPRLQNLHYYLYILGSSITALFLGILGSLLMPDNILYQAFITIIIVSVVGAAVQSLHASYFASANYLTLSLLPLLLWQVLQISKGNGIYIGIFLATSCYILYLAVDVYSGYLLLVNNIKLKLENMTFAEKVKKQKYLIEIESEIASSLQSCVNENKIFLILFQQIPQLFPNYSGIVSILVENEKNVRNVISWGDYLVEKVTFIPDECEALCNEKSNFHKTNSAEGFCEHLGKRKYGSLCIPLFSREQILGLLTFIFDRQIPDHEEIEIMHKLASDVSLALTNIRLHNYLQKLSTYDALTNLYNRRYLEEKITHMISIHKEQKNEFSIIMIDIDYFKRINDTLGHDAGDKVLREVGKYIKIFFCETDDCFRYGGEEFLIILKETTAKQAMEKAEKFRKAISNIPILLNGKVEKIITISAGIANYPLHGNSVISIINSADKALYLAKAKGRNQVSMLSPELVV